MQTKINSILLSMPIITDAEITIKTRSDALLAESKEAGWGLFVLTSKIFPKIRPHELQPPEEHVLGEKDGSIIIIISMSAVVWRKNYIERHSNKDMVRPTEDQSNVWTY